MKTLFIAITFLASIPGLQEKAESVKVKGNCKMCKARIEKSLKIDGVSVAEWDTETKVLKVTYDTQKIDMDKIQKAVAASGYDTEKYPAIHAAFLKLPMCCRYEREK